MGLGRLTSNTIIHTNQTNQTTSWLVRSWNTLVHGRATGKHEPTRFTMAQTWGKPPLSPYNILCACPWDQDPNVTLSQDSQVGVPNQHPNVNLSQLKLLQRWGRITLCVDLWLRWSLFLNSIMYLKFCCSPCRELSNGMWHTTYTQGNRGDSWLLMVGSQIDSRPFFWL
jgi:hypothetical protein